MFIIMQVCGMDLDAAYIQFKCGTPPRVGLVVSLLGLSIAVLERME